MADKHKGQEPGEDVALAFDMNFDDEAPGGGRPEQSFGAPEPAERGSRRAAPPPPALDDDFEEMPEPGSDFGAPARPPRDDFGDVGHADAGFGGEQAASAFGHDEDPVEDFDAVGEEHEHDNAFANAEGGDMEFEAEHGHAEEAAAEDDDAALRHDDHEDDEDVSVAPEAAGRSLMQRMMAPAIGLAGALAIGWAGWSFVLQPMFFAEQPVQTAQLPGIRTQPQVGMPQNGQPPAPPFQAAQQRPGGQAPGLAPLAPAAQQAAPPRQTAQAPQQLPPVQTAQAAPQIQAQPIQAQPGPQQVATADPAPLAGAPAPVGNPLFTPPITPLVQGQPQGQPQGQVPTGMNRPSDDVMAKMFAAIDAVSTDVRTMTRRVDAIEKNGNDMRADLGRRMDDIESRKGGTKVATAAPGALPPVTVSAPALGKAAAPKAVKAAPKASDDADEERAERPAKRPRHAVRQARAREDADADSSEDKAYAGDGSSDEPPAKPRVIGAYRLQGVSQVGGRSVALLRTKRGLEEVAVGQTLPGGGEVRSIRENGGRWVVVTSRGVIVE